MSVRPSRVSPPRTWPGGVQLVGPLVRIPGRMLSACPADVAELRQHIASCQAALDALLTEFPEADQSRG